MNPISSALINGYSTIQILQYLKNLSPTLKKKINEAEKIGHAPEKILDFFSNSMESKFSSSYQTSNKIEGQKKKEYAEKVKKGLGLGLGTLALGAYAIGKKIPSKPSNLTPSGAVRPSAIYPAQAQPQQLGQPQGRLGLPAPAAQAGVKQAPNAPRPNTQPPSAPISPNRQITTPQPSGSIIPMGTPQPASITPQVQAPSKAMQLAEKYQFLPHIQQLNKNLKDPAQIAAVLYNQFPKEMQALQKEAGQPMENVIAEVLQSMPQEQQPEQNIPAKPPEKMPIQVNYKPENINEKPLDKPKLNVKEAAFGAEPLKKLSEVKPLKERSFAIPTYKLPTETPKEFHNREIISSAIEKAAKEISQDKTFLDLPSPFGKTEFEEKEITRGPRKGTIERNAKHERFTRSVAGDVLRYLAGVPNPYESLLDDEEKEELADSVNDGNIYGAQMTPNLVWNMLLTAEPRLQDVEIPKSVKGYPKLPGGKMGTAELRRHLTHAVYGVLSGKKITTQLKDKIAKISEVTSSIDAIAKASHQGRLNEMIKEQERMLEDDEYFFNLYSDEILEQAAKLR